MFKGGLFLLKLTNDISGLNAEVYSDYELNYSLGESFTTNNCNNSISTIPELADDNLTYNYMLSIAIATPGDYCIVNAFGSNFNFESENNAQIFNDYNTLENEIKFDDCDVTFTRTGTDVIFSLLWNNSNIIL